ncbi:MULTISPECIES: MarP family serine protease [Corynebacterium]|uniref:Membrane protein n=1 Tax=Corynebacterium flavescens TaxID=28028 RepID=A0A1L7CJE9_CORFL|nr:MULTISPECIES: MarP family serine protease [Corynebacterium]APT85982.1 membrane protein [Corynebacterium flavescens]KAA8724651.1 MarP family serine protease [Corynebacterium flavescens]MDN6099073.1 MarP family serine protease [Corynebacterium flavescens]MDN6199488.1 MarP family serine protease [Corynebacterium flavescens]MDN6225815.1 MarP family serine protease [Corynebacterium flavescens]
MTPWLVVDALIVVAVALALLSGWRQGAISAVLSLAGVVSGLVLGATAAPFAMQLTDQVALRFLLGIGVVVLLVGLGQLVGASIGANLRDRMKARSSQRLDSGIGSVFQVLAALLVIWLVSLPLASNLGGSAGQGMRESRILGGLNRVAPEALSALPNKVAAMLNESGLPPLVSPWQSVGGAGDVGVPDSEVDNPELIQAVRPSVIHVLGDAEVCSRRLMGSGFVTAEDYVITNAHVVAGTERVHLDTVDGLREAKVVYYNPDVDVAVLYSPNLGIAPLEWASQPAQTGDDAIVLGFPLSGPFEADMARVRDRITIAGPDIYSRGRVERDAYTVRGSIRQGNSGGPMINEQGQVLGVVFGASVDDSQTGYALSAEEVQGHIGDVNSLRKPADTGSCVAN